MTGENLKTKGRPIPAILRTLQDASLARAESLRSDRSMDSLVRAGRCHAKRSLSEALTRSTPSIIAEVKKASPSKGAFRPDFDPVALAASYREGGAAAISVVTELDHFQGRAEWVTAIRANLDLPILRKDFIVDEIQVAESAAIGADAILLIARILTEDQIVRLSTAAAEVGLEVVHEAHDAQDVEKIQLAGARIVGINARNLDNFLVDTALFKELYPLIPSTAVAIAESGLEQAAQIRNLFQIGYQGFLIGEALIRSGEPANLIRQLRQVM